MRKFFTIINSNKALKLTFCVVVSIIIWLIVLFITPEKPSTPASVEVTGQLIVPSENPATQDQQSSSINETIPPINSTENIDNTNNVNSDDKSNNQQNSNDKENNSQSQGNKIKENLNYVYCTSSEYIRIFTTKNKNFTEKYVKETLRPQLFEEMLSNKTLCLDNVSIDQATGVDFGKAENYNNAFIETGTIKGRQYGIGYTIVKDNVICTVAFYDTPMPQNSIKKVIKSTFDLSDIYIYQARNS